MALPLHSRLLALLTLVLFGLGGIGAPVLHRAAHAAERDAAHHAAHAAAEGHVHGEGVGVTGPLPEWLDLDEACALCQLQLASVQIDPAAGFGAAAYAPATVAADARASHGTRVHYPVRGPPARS